MIVLIFQFDVTVEIFKYFFLYFTDYENIIFIILHISFVACGPIQEIFFRN